GPCVHEMPWLEEAHRRYARRRDVVFTAVSIDSQKEVVAPWVQKHGITIPVLYTDGTVEDVYCSKGIPSLYVLNARGSIRFSSVGWLDDGSATQRLDWMIERALR